MHIGEIVGGVALVGVAVLVGIALIDDDAPEIITEDTSPFVFDTAAITSTSSSSSTEPPVASTQRTTPPALTTASSPPPTSTPTSAEPAAPTTTLIPPERRSGIALRVLNGGAPARAATNMSDLLRAAGFAPAGPADAPRLVPATRVIFAPGREGDAATVNEVIGAPPENVVPASIDDTNWAEFGGGLAVLVVLGPVGT